MKKEIVITFPNQQKRQYPVNITGYEVAKDISISLAKSALAIKINDDFRSLSEPIINDCAIDIITSKSNSANKILNLTMAIIISQAIITLTSKAIIINIDSSDENFTIDFDINDQTLKEKDLKSLIEITNKLIGEKLIINDVNLDLKDSKKYFNNNKYILEKLETLKANAISNQSFYTIDNKNYFWNNGSIFNTEILTNNFSILNLSGVYWQDDATKNQIQRIMGVAKFNEKDLQKYLEELEIRKKSDHRYLGKELEIFMFDLLAGQGFPIWLPNGMIIKKQLQQYLRTKENQYDYLEVATPVVGSINLYKTSGHWSHYQENMFKPIDVDNEQLVLRPMSCPHHCLIYKNKLRSYRDLPLRLSEHELLYRYEYSGSLTGLERVRAMELTDSHIFCRDDQIKNEFKQIFNLISEVLKDLKIEINYYSLSLHDPKNKSKYYDDVEMWTKSENLMRSALKELNIKYVEMIGEAAFYGPKLDFQIKTVLGHEVTVSTIQLDFLLAEKFDLYYIDENNEKVKPIIIHRGLIGTYERFIATLLEQTKGILPFWLAPQQIAIIPVNNVYYEHCLKLQQLFKDNNLRSYIVNNDQTLNFNIRETQMKKIPLQLVIGKEEIANNSVTYRKYGTEKQIKVRVEEFLQLCFDLINNKI